MPEKLQRSASALLRTRAGPEPAEVLLDPGTTAHTGQRPRNGQAQRLDERRGLRVRARYVDEDGLPGVPSHGIGQQSRSGRIIGDARADLPRTRAGPREQEARDRPWIAHPPDRVGMLV